MADGPSCLAGTALSEKMETTFVDFINGHRLTTGVQGGSGRKKSGGAPSCISNDERANKPTINSLPPEIMQIVGTYLGWDDLARLCLVQKEFVHLSCSPTIKNDAAAAETIFGHLGTVLQELVTTPQPPGGYRVVI